MGKKSKKPLIIIFSILASTISINTKSNSSMNVFPTKQMAYNIFQEEIQSNKYNKLYLIEWDIKDDRNHRREILILVGGAVSGLINQFIKTGGAWFDKWLDDLGQENKDWEESDEVAKITAKEFQDSIKNYHPIYSYKATVNNKNEVYFIVGLKKSKFLRLKRYDVVMITERFSFIIDDDLKFIIEKEEEDPKVFKFSTLLSARISPLKEKMKRLEILKNNNYFRK